MEKNSDILFSIVIPTFNRANLIVETLDSVLTQTYKNYEIIIVDNCSTDNTKEVLQKYIDQKQIIYICNEKNFERAYSRNVGMKHAKGDFLTLLDSDDFMYPNCLEDAAQFIQNNPWCYVFHNKFEVLNNSREVIYKTPYTSLNNQYKALCSGNFLSAIGGFIHKDIYTKFRFSLDPKMIGAEDYEFWFQILARYELGRIDKYNSGLREHPARSVNIDAYNQLHYQCNMMVDLIKGDVILSSKFGKYTGRLKAAYKLQEIIVNRKTFSFSKKAALLIKAAKDDLSVLFTKRYFAVLINLFRS
ncbi:MAG: glycosyltransferase [Bacteroidetes bacterium]|nr:glycosyltransferase [Bacteroidota bacterium]